MSSVFAHFHPSAWFIPNNPSHSLAYLRSKRYSFFTPSDAFDPPGVLPLIKLPPAQLPSVGSDSMDRVLGDVHHPQYHCMSIINWGRSKPRCQSSTVLSFIKHLKSSLPDLTETLFRPGSKICQMTNVSQEIQSQVTYANVRSEHIPGRIQIPVNNAIT